ncbi:MAG: cytochrome c biogenesis protein CcsA [Magnetococcales bacterium]|nr:cytochrome c biogenesis protein CcsA [Magnetococcales bacterium]MBF0157165.1 cytochrome c biogenesis protein CcsA [Magnetococcales bacterium]
MAPLWEAEILWIGLLFYVAGGSLGITGELLRLGPWTVRWVTLLLTLGLLLHALSLGLRWVRIGHGPFVTLFEILSSNLWSLTLALLLAYRALTRLRGVLVIAMPPLFLMVAWILLTDPEAKPLPPTYETLWLYIHIGFGKIFLGFLLIAAAVGGIILSRAAPSGRRLFANLPQDDRLDELAYRLMLVALAFDSLMLISGAIWAQEAWGRYWDWDPLEVWSLINWLWLVFALHLRPAFALSPKGSAMVVVIAFLIAFLNFFGVPFLSKAPHQGIV